uniref:Uncharacterized protein n=1 Tax=Panagrolaimus sp. PS1159 TaxID=55785 RepID=A0AC35FIK3_9BILA
MVGSSATGRTSEDEINSCEREIEEIYQEYVDSIQRSVQQYETQRNFSSLKSFFDGFFKNEISRDEINSCEREIEKILQEYADSIQRSVQRFEHSEQLETYTANNEVLRGRDYIYETQRNLNSLKSFFDGFFKNEISRGSSADNPSSKSDNSHLNASSSSSASLTSFTDGPSLSADSRKAVQGTHFEAVDSQSDENFAGEPSEERNECVKSSKFNEAIAIYNQAIKLIDQTCSSRKRTHAKELDVFYNFLNNDIKVTRDYIVPTKKAKTVEKFFEVDTEPDDRATKNVLQSFEAADELENEEEETIQMVGSSATNNNNIQNAQTLIEEGHECVKASKFNDAIERKKATDLNREPSYFNYRDAAYHHLRQHDLAFKDCCSAVDEHNKRPSRKRTISKELDSFSNFLNNDAKVTRDYMIPSKKAKTVQKFFEADKESEEEAILPFLNKNESLAEESIFTKFITSCKAFFWG